MIKNVKVFAFSFRKSKIKKIAPKKSTSWHNVAKLLPSATTPGTITLDFFQKVLVKASYEPNIVLNFSPINSTNKLIVIFWNLLVIKSTLVYEICLKMQMIVEFQNPEIIVLQALIEYIILLI